jgi:limonene-1,2-epoxide hydrolase
MSASPESVVRNFFAAWADPNLDDLVSFFSDDAVFIDGPRGVHRGVNAIKSEFEAWQAMEMGRPLVDVKSLVAEAGTVMMERVDNFHLGGQPFSLEVMAAFEVGTDGRITRWRDYYDLQSLVDEVSARLLPASESTSG